MPPTDAGSLILVTEAAANDSSAAGRGCLPAKPSPAPSAPRDERFDRIRACLHDLRNPIGAAAMAAALLRSALREAEGALAPAQRAMARTALTALAESVDQMRHLADAVGAELPEPLVPHGAVRPRPVAPAEGGSRRMLSLRRILERLEVLVVTRQATPGLLSVHCPEDVLVPGDGPELLRALSNLVENAFEAAHAGPSARSDPRVAVTVRRSGSQVQVCVANPGAPMPPAWAEFLEGRREAPPAACRGNGVGLGVVRRVVRGHGGKVTVGHRRGITRVCLHLPCRDGRDGGARSSPGGS